ncbi:MAG TPA: hypothetical protein DC006_02830, partial [Prevotellaceae bacterium]|nr:hypothetical protein [Prevotellaceae bacterium]
MLLFTLLRLSIAFICKDMNYFLIFSKMRKNGAFFTMYRRWFARWRTWRMSYAMWRFNLLISRILHICRGVWHTPWIAR